MRPMDGLRLALAALASLVAVPSFAALLRVPDDYPTIQAAINAAEAGDEVRVAAGTYTGTGNKDLDLLGKDIAVVGDGPGLTILDCYPYDRGFHIHRGETTAARIEGFEIRNAWEEGAGGGGIRIAGAHPRVKNCMIVACSAGWNGGGIYIDADGPTEIEDCVIRGNTARDHGDDGGYGGGIFANGPVTIRRCRIANNLANSGAFGGGAGGGISVEAGVRLEDCVIEGNTSQGGDGGGGVDAEACALVRCRIIGNTSMSSAGGVLAWSGLVTLEECLVAGNLAWTWGGGLVALGSGQMEVRGTTVASNHTMGVGSRRGGGLACRAGGAMVMTRAILWGNCSGSDAPEGYVDSASSLLCTCSDVNDSGLLIAGQYSAFGCIALPPRFCLPRSCDEAPTVLGEYTLQEGSPCLPEQSPPCGGLIGALGQGCGGPVPVERLSWGRVKNRFR